MTDWIEISIGIVCLISGILQIINGRATERYALARGFLGSERAVKISALYLIGCGVLCMLQELAHYGGYGFVAFLLMTNFTVHKFWDEGDRLWRASEGLHFFKNLVMAVLITLYFTI